MMIGVHKADILQRLRDFRRHPDRLAKIFAPDLEWHCQHPVNDGHGSAALFKAAVLPLITAMHDVERRDDIFMVGQFRGNLWIAAMGHYCGTFTEPLFGIPPTGHLAFLRYGEFYRLSPNNIIVETVSIWDMIGLMQQAGVNPLPPSPGVEIVIPGPRTHDGIPLLDPHPGDAHGTLKLVEAMIAGLMEYDGKTLESMAQERFWSPEMNWYGPAGIGSNRRLKGFQDYHQRPFLTAFPDRKGGNHKGRIGDGMYCASTGWPSIQATHAGPYLGQPATNKRITMRVMDFWRRENDLLAENWVFIDLPDLFRQFGRDLFGEMQVLAAKS
jgi:predicted ester cyclase